MSASILSSSINLINNIVGAGLFSMPWCLRQATVVTGCAVFILIACLNIVSFMLLADSCERTGTFSYLEMGERAFGRKFGVVAQLTTMFYASGSLISYEVLAGDFIVGNGTGILDLWEPDVFGPSAPLSGLSARAVVCGALTLFVLLPLCLLRSIDSLRFTSYAALLATLFAGFICVYELAAAPASSLSPTEAGRGPELRRSVAWAGFPLTVWEAVPIINVAFCAHYNAPRYYKELADRSLPRYLRTTGGALGVSLLIYLAVGLSGYLAFGSATLGDVLENFSPSFALAVAARVALVLVLVSCFPKAAHPIRETIIKLAYGPAQSADTLPFSSLAAITVGVTAAATIVGVLCEQVEVVLAYKGAIFGSLMVYIFPALMHASLAAQGVTPLSVQGGADVYKPTGRAVAPSASSSMAEPLVDGAAPPSDGVGAPPPSVPRVVAALLFSRRHLPCSVLFVWGSVSSVLGVTITVLHQAGVKLG